MKFLSALVFAGSVQAAAAQDLPPLACEGREGNWTLTIAGPAAQLTLGDVFELQVAQETRPENSPWPIVQTLVGNRQTAISLVTERLCSSRFVTSYPFEITLLTQRGETPLVLTGCCTAAE